MGELGYYLRLCSIHAKQSRGPMRAILSLSLYKIKAEPVSLSMSTQSLFINTWGAVSKVTTLWRLGHLISRWSGKGGWTAPPTPIYTASLPVQLCPLGPSVFINSMSPHKLHLKCVREECHKKMTPISVRRVLIIDLLLDGLFVQHHIELSAESQSRAGELSCNLLWSHGESLLLSAHLNMLSNCICSVHY